MANGMDSEQTAMVLIVVAVCAAFMTIAGSVAWYSVNEDVKKADTIKACLTAGKAPLECKQVWP